MSGYVRYGVPHTPVTPYPNSRIIKQTTAAAPPPDALPNIHVVTADGPIAAPFVGYTSFKIKVAPPERQLLSPVFVVAQQSPNQQVPKPFVFVEQQPSPFVAPPDAPARTTTVAGQQVPQQQPYSFVSNTHVEDQASVEPLVVRAIELPWSPPEILIVQGRSAPAAPPDTPQRAIVVAAQQPAAAQPFVKVNEPSVGPAAPAPEVPIRPTVVTADGPIGAPQIGVVGFNADSGIAPAAPDTPSRSTVVPQSDPQQPTPFVSVSQPKVFAAAPVAGDKPTRMVVVTDVTPPQPVDQVLLWTVVSDGTPPRATVVDAGPLPLGKPYTYVAKGSVPLAAQPPVPIEPTIVRAEPWPPPVQVPWIEQQKVDLAAQPPVPIEPTVVKAQPVPPEPGRASVSHGFAEALAAPETPPKPIVIGAQPYPPKIQEPHVAWTPFDEKIVGRPTIIGQQPLPPQAPFIQTRAFTFGPPPPVLRHIQPSVTTDLSLPYRPLGRALVRRGFAEALPLLYEGLLVGGTLEGALVSGGILTGSSIGGTIQNAYITGGQR